jgi:hypothetical protein
MIAKSKFLPLFVILLLSTILSVFQFVPSVKATGANWLTGWTYRKTHMVNYATGAGTLYQINITVYYADGTSTLWKVYLNGKCRTDFGDVRFTDDDGSTLLDCWMENKIDSNNAVFWVEVADSLETESQTIYVYYGNAGVSTTSNGDNTFPFFDDFEDNNINATKWGISYNVVESSSQLHISAVTNYDSRALGKVAEGQNYNIKFKMRRTNTNNSHFNAGFNSADFSKFCFWTYASWSSTLDHFTSATKNSAEHDMKTAQLDTDWHTWDVFRNAATNVQYYIDANLKETETTQIPSDNEYAFFRVTHNTGKTDGQIDVEWVLIRKRVATEPNHGSWGNEETGGYALNLRVMDWDLTDAISGATVYKDTDTKVSNGGGWANWTGVSGTVAIQVKYFGFWVNGTFSVSMDSDKTINVHCKLYDITVTAKPNNTIGIISGANVTAYNNTGTSNGKIKSGITVDTTGQVTLTNVPNATLRFIMYAKSDYSIIIANTTQLISSDGYSFNIVANQNYAVATLSLGYEAIIWMNALSILHLLSIVSIIVHKKLKKRMGR